MLIEALAPDPDATEKHSIEIRAPRAAVYRALWSVDFGASWVLRGLLFLRTLPKLLLDPTRLRTREKKLTLGTIIEAGFGRLAEEPGHEVVLGVAGRFWRPVGNLLPFREDNFKGPVPSGIARAVWNFSVREVSAGLSVLATETRVTCGDAASRLKFRMYWLVVGPFSAVIRRIMLKAVRRSCESVT